MRNSWVLLLGLAIAACSPSTDDAKKEDDAAVKPATETEQRLPHADLSTYLAEVDPTAKEKSRKRTVSVLDARIRKTSRDSIFSRGASEGDGIEQPLQSSNELIILLEPKLTREEAKAAIEEHGLKIVHALPEIGAIVVDATELLEAPPDGPEMAAVDIGKLKDIPLNRLAERLSADPRFKVVTPNTVVTPFSIQSAVKVDLGRPRSMLGQGNAEQEVNDWGITHANIDDIWPRLNQVIDIGIIDVGFADHHEDLVLTPGLSHNIPVRNHGTHVAGTMCALHDNGKGIRGVLTKCNAKISAGSFFLEAISPIEDREVIGFHTLFDEVLATVIDFITVNPDVKTINLSLGYNWMPNFGIDPRKADKEIIRDLIRGQGRIFLSILDMARKNDIAIVSAAGNDSTSLSTPLPAQWASPFNFGSFMMKERDGWTNGIIVQAHDQDSKRAEFSNVEGHISCPGVRVFSTVAAPENAYGFLSGTSMASPYCAASLAALRSLRPDLTLRQAIDCLLASPDKIDGVPKLDLLHSVDSCPVNEVAESPADPPVNE